MNRTIIPILLLTLSSIFAFGHAIAERQAPPVNVEPTSTQPNLTPDDMVMKGNEYFNNQNYIEAVKWFRKAAEKGYTPGYNWLVHMANNGDTNAQNILGALYEKGTGVNKDYSEAVKWYRMAAERGNAEGQNNLGYMYRHGYGVAKDDSEAVKWYRKAAAQGYTQGENNLGYMYYHGYGVEKNLSEAKKWRDKVVAQGFKPSWGDDLENLIPVTSQLVEKGKVAKDNKNYTEAVSLFRQAADQGDADGEYWLSHMYFYGYGVPKDYSECLKWCRKAAEQGHIEAMNSLGKMYYHGGGVAKDYSEAMKWWKKAAEQGHAAAQYNLALIYENGLGIPKDYSEAMKWLRKSAEQGIAAANTDLGNMYYYGLGVQKDYSEAMKWWKKAAEQGHADGQNNLALIYEKGLGVPKDYSEAVKWLRKSAEQGNAHGQNRLGNMYYNGYGVAKDLTEAKKWWEKAAAQGHKEAQENLKKLPTPNPTPTPTPAEGIPSLFWIECPSKTATSQFTLKVGINSKSTITGYEVTLNGSAARGIKTVKNDGYDMLIDQPLTLAEGNNEIRVEVTNGAGRTVETRSVVYEKVTKPTPVPVQVQKRIALVVGNGAYTGAPLRNTLNDASAIASELRKLGFDVIFISDADRRKFDSAVNDFGQRARDYDVAMFYYAGHGIQYKGENFLVPVDATLSSQSDVEYECVNVNRILSKLEDSDVKMKIIALDACRNNPFERSWHRGTGTSRGLSAINVPIGTFISYATSPGTVAADGEGNHSPYTSALLQTLKESNLSIENVFKKVASIVVSTTGRSQLPWYTSSLFEGEFVFNPSQK